MRRRAVVAGVHHTAGFHAVILIRADNLDFLPVNLDAVPGVRLQRGRIIITLRVIYRHGRLTIRNLIILYGDGQLAANRALADAIDRLVAVLDLQGLVAGEVGYVLVVCVFHADRVCAGGDFRALALEDSRVTALVGEDDLRPIDRRGERSDGGVHFLV